MKRQSSLPELVEQLQADNLRKKDFVVPANAISMKDGNVIVSNSNGKENEKLADLLDETGIAHEVKKTKQMTLECMNVADENLCAKLDLPRKYYNRCSGDHMAMRDGMVSYWAQQKGGNLFLRTFIDKKEKQGYVRSILSDKFRVIDNYDVLLACLDAVKESGVNLQIQHCDLTERKMYMRFIAPDIQIDAPEILKNYKVPDGNGRGGSNNGIVTGFVISNSEVGQGQFTISPRAVVLACANGMIREKDAFKKTHLGGQMEEYSAIDWSDETKQKNYDLICAQVKDAVKTFCSEGYLGGWVQEMQEKGQKQLENPLDTVKNVTTHLGVTEEKERDILNYFLKGSDFTGFGVTQALTYHAQKTEDADEQQAMETQAVEILENIGTFDNPTKKKGRKTAAREN